MTDWAAIVMAAGSGTRMRSQTPKVLHTVCGRTMLRCVLDAARSAGFSRRVLVVGPASDRLRDAAGEDVSIAVQAPANGTAGAVQSAAASCGDAQHVLVLNADLPLIEPQTLQRLRARHEEARAVMSLLTTISPDATGLARIKRSLDGNAVAIVEERDAPAELRSATEVNAGVYCFEADWLWSHLGSVQPSPITGELYLTALLALAVSEGARITSASADWDEVRGVNSRSELAAAEAIAADRVRRSLLAAGVSLVDPASVYVDFGVQVGEDSIIHPNTSIRGETVIGEGCEIGPNSIIRSSRIGARCRVLASVVEEAVVEDDVEIGPFSHLRPGASIGKGAQLGNYAEVKQSRIGPGTQMHHFSYIGDATVGEGVNIGAGTITCNFDGSTKHETFIGAGAFIGSDTMLVAPVSVGEGGRTGAGSVVTRNVAAGALVVGVPARPLMKRPVQTPVEEPPAEDPEPS